MRAKIISITCLLGTAAATAFAAPSLSQPGQDIKGQMPAPQAQVEKAAEPAPQASEVKFKLTGVELDASELKVDAAALEAMLAPCVGRETMLTELNAALARVTAYCRSHGYLASAAYLPAQDSKDGKVTIKIIPGRYGEIKLENHSRLKDKVESGSFKHRGQNVLTLSANGTQARKLGEQMVWDRVGSIVDAMPTVCISQALYARETFEPEPVAPSAYESRGLRTVG